MKKNQLNSISLILLGLLLISTAITACKKDDVNLTILDSTELTQTAFADEETTGKGFTFTATKDWTASVKENTKAKGSGVSWLKLICNGVETYSGGAGTFTMVISLEKNLTGETRVATIEIASGSDKITVTVTQKGITQDEDSNGMLPSEIKAKYDGEECGIKITYDNQNRIRQTEYYPENFILDYTYDASGKLTKITFRGEGEINFTYSGNFVTHSWGGSDNYYKYELQDGRIIKEYEKPYWSNEERLCWVYSYDSKGNVIKKVNELEHRQESNTYADKNGIFSAINIPHWILSKDCFVSYIFEWFPGENVHAVNNPLLHEYHRGEYSGSYTYNYMSYNNNNYPTKFTINTGNGGDVTYEITYIEAK